MAQKKIVVIGGGIVGISTAYFLSQHASSPAVTLLEASAIAAGASGKAGGLLALDWHGNDTASLARLSYQLHASLAEKYNGRERWGYRELTTLEIECVEGKTDNQPPSDGTVPDWLYEGIVKKMGTLGSPQTTAQIHPRRFCEAIINEIKNFEFLMAYATKIILDDDKKAKGVEIIDGYNKKVIPADVIVVAAGPWTTALLPNIPVSSQRAHSITIATPTPVSPHALFTNIKMKNGSVVTPEIYPRADEIYACGDVDNLEPLPRFARDVEWVPEKCWEIVKNVSVVSEILQKGEVITTQACYLPYSEIGPGPAIGWVPGMRNVAVGAGHSCWGICNAPGTGLLLTELICDGRISSANIQTLDPGRYTR